MKSILWAVALTATASIAATIIFFFPARARAQSPQAAQIFTPARFALQAAEVTVAQLQQPGSNKHKMLFKIDTVTGQVWVLQLATTSSFNPQVRSAVWTKVQSGGVFSPFAPVPEQNQSF